jgi:hypothetical protein
MFLLHVKESLITVELNPDMDCIGRVTAFKYVIPDGLSEATETGAALLQVPMMVHLQW